MDKVTQTIEDLWNGNITPCENCGSHDPKLKQLRSLMGRNHDKLCEGLTEAQKETFQKYLDCSDEYFLRMLELAFCDGFCLGSKLAAESLT